MFVLATQKIILRHDVFVGDDSNLSEVLKRTYKIILLKFLAKVFVQGVTEFVILFMISHCVIGMYFSK